MSHDLLAIGVMTGNSMDAADIVLTRFSKSGEMEDLAFHSLPVPRDLYARLQTLRTAINESKGDVATVAQKPENDFEAIHDAYINHVAQAIKELIAKAHQTLALTDRFGAGFAIDIVGNHGQTVAHFPPSIIKDKASDQICTVQLGNGQQLADLIGIPVVFDFRSDDVMNGGEGAPLAPEHNKAMAIAAKRIDAFPIAFCNAGNTGNIALITTDTRSSMDVAQGWDTGPFNYFTDQLCQREKGEACDKDAKWGSQGRVQPDLLQILFDQAVIKNDGSNYLLAAPPKSSDGQWYKLLPELMGQVPVNGATHSFEDRLRTAQYFSAYIYFHTLSFVPEHLAMPKFFAVFGGGWRNPVQLGHFKDLIAGRFEKTPVLPQHKELFAAISTRLLANTAAEGPVVDWSERFGFAGESTEARIFAHAAIARIQGVPFSTPTSTGCTSPTIGGIIRFPPNNRALISPNLADWLKVYDTKASQTRELEGHDLRWSRASKGWRQKKILAL